MKEKKSDFLRVLFLTIPIVDVSILLLAATMLAMLFGICLVLSVGAFVGCAGVLLWDGLHTLAVLSLSKGMGMLGAGITGMLLGELDGGGYFEAPTSQRTAD